ncbi:hypothetical protein MUK42_22950 [Musa troglodytarum]|uniref:Uncharacterized protein n=1 Tax=Musa troglodytarum TaxID=320322 RepID=A0A9E7KB65_9LILI|nr:hypothetical protein MUK42_22950 [Musa troglodytarum]
MVGSSHRFSFCASQSCPSRSTGVAPRDFHKLKVRMDESCKVACRTKLSSEAAKNFMVKSDDECCLNMLVSISQLLFHGL